MKIKLTKELLQKYVYENLSREKIAELTGYSKNTIQKYSQIYYYLAIPPLKKEKI